MEIRYSKAATKAIRGMDKATKKQIHEGILGLTEKPPKGDIKVMQGHSDGERRLRVGKYRVIYKYALEDALEILHIINIGSRGDIYK